MRWIGEQRVCSVDSDPAAEDPAAECRTVGLEGCGDCFRRRSEVRARAENVRGYLHSIIAPLPAKDIARETDKSWVFL